MLLWLTLKSRANLGDRLYRFLLSQLEAMPTLTHHSCPSVSTPTLRHTIAASPPLTAACRYHTQKGFDFYVGQYIAPEATKWTIGGRRSYLLETRSQGVGRK